MRPLSCNWDYFRTDATSCNSGTYRGSSMCASCEYGYCTERSTFAACYNPFSYSLGTSKAQLCVQQGGIYEPTDPSVLCYYPAVADYASCMTTLNATAFCSPTCASASCRCADHTQAHTHIQLPRITHRVASCAPYCYFPSVPQANCSCAGLSPGDPLASLCATLRWNGFQCISTTIAYQEQCAALEPLGAQFWIGAAWQVRPVTT